MAGNPRESAAHSEPRRAANPNLDANPNPHRNPNPISLVDLAKRAEHLQGIRREDLGRGDWVAVRTRNSWYSLFHLGDGAFLVSGGWFDQQQLAPAIVTVNGCTWGGSAILAGAVACIGLFIEFGNGVTTTRVREVHVIRGDSPQN